MVEKKRLEIVMPDWDDEDPIDEEPEWFKTRVKASQVKAGRGTVAHAGILKVALFRLRDGIVAIKNACPHAGAPLSGGQCRGDLVTCPRHGWAFNVRTGACLSRPMYEVKSYQVKVVDGVVWVAV